MMLASRLQVFDESWSKLARNVFVSIILALLPKQTPRRLAEREHLRFAVQGGEEHGLVLLGAALLHCCHRGGGEEGPIVNEDERQTGPGLCGFHPWGVLDSAIPRQL